MFVLFDWASIDSSSLEVFIVPNQLYFEDPDYSPSFHDLTWKIIDYTEYQMIIKLNFTETFEVSSFAE